MPKSKHRKSKSQRKAAFKNWTETHRTATTLLIIVSVPVVIVLIIAIIFLAKITAESLERQTLAIATKNEAITARAAKEQTFNTAHQHKIDILKSAGVVSLQDTTYSSKLDTCGMAAIEAGWVATDWTQYCTLKYADILPTSLSREEILSRLSSHIETASLFGEAATGRFIKVCDELYKLYNTRDRSSLNYYTWGVDAQNRSNECFLPTQKNGEFGRIITDSDSETRVVRSFKTSDVDRSKNYIGVFSDKEYYRSKRLGCYGHIFCEPPFEMPQSGFRQ